MGNTDTNVLNEEMDRILGKMKDVDPKTEEYGKMADNLLKVMRFKSEDHKTFSEIDARYSEIAVMEKEAAIKEAELKRTKVMDVLKIAIPTGLSLTQMIFLGIWMKNSFEFEEKGTITTMTGRKVFDQIFKLK